MNPEENKKPIVSNGEQAAEQTLCNETTEVRKHYFPHHLLLNPDVPTELSDTAWLLSLKRRTVRFVELLSLLEHSSVEEIPVLQKACFFDLTEDNLLPQRTSVDYRSVEWSPFQCRINEYEEYNVSISKHICQKANREAEVEYYIDVNEIYSRKMSFEEFVAVYRKLGEFLSKQS